MSFWCQIKTLLCGPNIPQYPMEKSARNIADAFLRSHGRSLRKARRLWQTLESREDWKIWNCCCESGVYDPMNLTKWSQAQRTNLIPEMEEWIESQISDASHAICGFCPRTIALLAEMKNFQGKFFLSLRKMDGLEFTSPVKRWTFRVFRRWEWFAPHFERWVYMGN